MTESELSLLEKVLISLGLFIYLIGLTLLDTQNVGCTLEILIPISVYWYSQDVK